MDFTGEFRTAIFGGYNKEDVRAYIKELQKNVEMSSFEYEKEIVGLKSKIKKLEDEGDSWKKEMQKSSDEEIMNAFQEENALKKENLEADLQLNNKYGEIQEELGVQLSENKQLRRKIAELESKVLLITKEKDSLEEELLQLQESSEMKKTGDLDMIAKVLEDARMNAKYIEEEAYQKADEIMNQARVEGEKFLNDKKALIDKELESKGIRLMAAKYKIDSFRSEISNTQQKLFELCSDMEKMVEEMPKRLDQLWEDGGYFSICDKKDSHE